MVIERFGEGRGEEENDENIRGNDESFRRYGQSCMLDLLEPNLRHS
jgi:hypothetical protein